MNKILTLIVLACMASASWGQNNVLTDQGESIEISPSAFKVNRLSNSSFNSGIGAGSLANLTAASGNQNNFAFGYRSLNQLQTGGRNISLGALSNLSLEDGQDNIAIGTAALVLNKGSENTAIGFLASGYAPLSQRKLAIGYASAAFDSSSSIVVGANAGLYAANATHQNFFLGANTGEQTRNGIDNVAIGGKAMRLGNGSTDNVAIGKEAMYLSAPSTFSNVAVGYEALRLDSTVIASNLDSRSNVAIGYQVMRNDTNSLSNVAIGYRSMLGSRNVDNSVSIGHDTFRFLREGAGNIGIGVEVGGVNTIIFGGGSIQFGLSKASDCTLIGYKSGKALISEGYRLTALGSQSLPTSNSGTYNLVAIGQLSGTGSTSGNNNTFLGTQSSLASGSHSNTTVIGYRAIGLASNSVTLGNDQVTTIGGYASFTNFSDKRLKTNITYDNTLGRNFIKKLKPATYHYKSQDSSVRKDGFIAQDVLETLQDLNTAFSGHIILDDPTQTQQLSYETFTLPLINSTQSLSTQLDNIAEKDWKALDLNSYSAKLK